jgi:hypothetical protein
MSSNTSLRERGVTPHLALIAVQIMFGTWPTFGKVALLKISSTGLVAFRVARASAAFLLLQHARGRPESIPLCKGPVTNNCH